MKKITLLLAMLAFAFIGQAQNPFETNTYLVHTVGNLGNAAETAIDVNYAVEVTPGPGENEITISDITGGLYPLAYSDGDDNPAVINVNTEDQTLSIVDQPDVVYTGGDVFNGSGTYTTNEEGTVVSFEYTWANGYGDTATSSFTLFTGDEAPGAPMNPTPADGATVDLNNTGDTDENGDPIYQLDFDWEEATTGGAAVTYDFWLGTDPATLSLVSTIGESDISIIGLDLNSTYYWQVVASNPNGEATSSTWSFNTSGTASITDLEMYDFDYIMNNDTKELVLTASKPMSSVKLFNILGQNVVNQKLSNDSEALQLSNLTSGIYIVQVEIDGRTASFKIVKK